MTDDSLLCSPWPSGGVSREIYNFYHFDSLDLWLIGVLDPLNFLDLDLFPAELRQTRSHINSSFEMFDWQVYASQEGCWRKWSRAIT